MGKENHTEIPQFILLGLSDDLKLQSILFGMFLFMYLATVLGNLLIILAVSSDSNLSFVDICFTSAVVPKMLVNFQTKIKNISYIQCLTQVYFCMVFAGMDNFLLIVMAFDCFVAICHPLNYTIIMIPNFCGLEKALRLLTTDAIFNKEETIRVREEDASGRKHTQQGSSHIQYGIIDENIRACYFKNLN